VVADGGRLSVGGCDVLDLAAEHGTPLFVYDEAHLRARCRQARAAFGDGVAYAAKAFLCRAMATLAHEEGLHLDVATGGELHVALAAGVPAERLVLHGNNKSDDELRRGLEAGVGRIVVDSFDEVDRLERLAPDGARVLVRVTPGVEAHTHEYVRTGQDDSKFGFGLATGAAREALDRLTKLDGVDVVGLHAHIGSQVFVADSFVHAIEVLAPFVNEAGLPELSIGPRSPSGPTPSTPPAGRPASRPGSRPSRGGPSWPTPPSRSTRWARSRTSPASAPTSPSTAA
jgi:diaminopimelate decarboxylase